MYPSLVESDISSHHHIATLTNWLRFAPAPPTNPIKSVVPPQSSDRSSPAICMCCSPSKSESHEPISSIALDGTNPIGHPLEAILGRCGRCPRAAACCWSATLTSCHQSAPVGGPNSYEGRERPGISGKAHSIQRPGKGISFWAAFALFHQLLSLANCSRPWRRAYTPRTDNPRTILTCPWLANLLF
jgi:hypothetical protein